MHFYLCGLEVPRNDSLEQFVEHVRERVGKIGNPQFVQVYEFREGRRVDVLVGMKYDFQATNYLHTNSKKVRLSHSGRSSSKIPWACSEKRLPLWENCSKSTCERVASLPSTPA